MHRPTGQQAFVFVPLSLAGWLGCGWPAISSAHQMGSGPTGLDSTARHCTGRKVQRGDRYRRRSALVGSDPKQSLLKRACNPLDTCLPHLPAFDALCCGGGGGGGGSSSTPLRPPALPGIDDEGDPGPARQSEASIGARLAIHA